MKIQVIASGSNGNCTYIEDGTTRILVDAGISCRRIEEALSGIGRSAGSLNAVLVTHEHSDHVAGLSTLVHRFGLPVYTCRKTADRIRLTDGRILSETSSFHGILPDKTFSVSSVAVRAIPTHHDAAMPVSFRLDTDRASFAILTDTGTVDDEMIRKLSGLNGILLESNHDIRMLEAGSYPYILKRRILGDFGHLSNETAMRILDRVLSPDLKLILLGHISEENNYPELVQLTLEQFLEQIPAERKHPDLTFEVAVRTHSTSVFEL